MNLPSAVIMCLDLALANTGIAVLSVEPQGKDQLLYVQTIHTEKCKKFNVPQDEWRRTTDLITELGAVIDRFKPVHIFIECPTGGSKSAVAARSMAVARGAVCACLHGLGKPATLISPFQAKAAATGNRTAEKHEVRDSVKKEFPDFTGWVVGKQGKVLAGANEHIYDAISVYMAAKATNTYKELKGHEHSKSEPESGNQGRPPKRKHHIHPTPEPKRRRGAA